MKFITCTVKRGHYNDAHKSYSEWSETIEVAVDRIKTLKGTPLGTVIGFGDSEIRVVEKLEEVKRMLGEGV